MSASRQDADISPHLSSDTCCTPFPYFSGVSLAAVFPKSSSLLPPVSHSLIAPLSLAVRKQDVFAGQLDRSCWAALCGRCRSQLWAGLVFGPIASHRSQSRYGPTFWYPYQRHCGPDSYHRSQQWRDPNSQNRSYFEAHCKLLGLEADADTDADADDRHQILTAPLFTAQVRDYAASSGSANFTQFGLLAGVVEDTVANGAPAKDPRLFYNVAAPSSIFICGRQGSGKSHTLSVLLENSLAPSDASTLPRPLTGIVFHYDRFVSDDSGAPCEAAYLSSNPSVKVRVLCAPTNVRYIRVGPPHHAEPRGLTRLFRALANAPRGHRTSTRPRGSTLVWTSCALTKRT